MHLVIRNFWASVSLSSRLGSETSETRSWSYEILRDAPEARVRFPHLLQVPYLSFLGTTAAEVPFHLHRRPGARLFFGQAL